MTRRCGIERPGPNHLPLRDADGEVTAEANPNGSIENIAGICNAGRNVLGMMPHPERASEPELGMTDGVKIFDSLVSALVAK